jgi:FkbM family methyltransferase
LIPVWLKRPIKELLYEMMREVAREIRAPVQSAIVASERPRFSQYLGNNTVLTETFFNRMIFVDGQDNSLSPHIMYGGRWEQWVTDLVIREVRPGHAVIDIGANLGFYTLLGAHLVGPSGIVLAFEPQKRLNYLLNRSIDINGFGPTTTLFPYALGDEEGTLLLNVDPLHLGGAMVRATAQQEGASEVRVTSLPVAMREANIDLGKRPLFIKMDVEGFEYSAWKGMRRTLAERDRVTMVLEFTPGAYVNQGHDPFAFVQDMHDVGFEVRHLTHTSDEIPLQRDVIQGLIDRGGFVDVVLRK